ncbi:MAG: elongator complex protein 3 [Pseudothermotoga sp.]
MKILPVFLPQMGCKENCVFCDQGSATGVSKAPELSKIDELVESYKYSAAQFEIAFYGGTFTGLPESVQEFYLNWANRYIKQGICAGIRISTRPDQIDEQRLRFLKNHNVSFIEIGAQSFDELVLKKSNRGHGAEDIEKACRLMRDMGIDYGLHLMVGLPADDERKDLLSAWKTVDIGARTCRIHPTLVLKNSALAKLFANGEYKPLSLENAIDICSKMVAILESHNVKVIRVGLFIPNDLEHNVIAGPYHPRFGELVRTDLVKKIVSHIKPNKIVYTHRQGSLLKSVDLPAQTGEEFGFLIDGCFLSWKDALTEYVSGGVRDVRTTQERYITTNRKCI